jgi:hypothetical protein
MMRSRTTAVRFALLLPLLLGACEDYSAEIKVVQESLVRHVAGSGETRTNRLGLTIPDFFRKEFQNVRYDLSWSGTTLEADGDAAPLVGVDAILKFREPFFPDRLVVHFSYDAAKQKVAYLGAEMDGKPAVLASGAPAKLGRIDDAIIDHLQGRASKFMNAMGGSAEFDAEMRELDEAQERN